MTVATHEVEGRERARGYSEVTSGAGVAAVSGQLPAEEILAASAGFAEQFASAMSRFTDALGAVGASSSDLLMMRIYVTDVGSYKASLKDLAPVYRETFDGQYPATTLVGVSELIDERALVEIEGLAATP
jgi:enamine deaminase RidA (YjgF/YER057c/UK114 family)